MNRGKRCPGEAEVENAAQDGWLDLHDSGIDGGILEDITVGTNWYLNPNMKVQWNYVNTRRDAHAPGVSDRLHALVMRLHLGF